MNSGAGFNDFIPNYFNRFIKSSFSKFKYPKILLNVHFQIIFKELNLLKNFLIFWQKLYLQRPNRTMLLSKKCDIIILWINKSPMYNIREIKTNKFRWLDIINANRDNLRYLKEKFNFNSVDLNECLPRLQRPKIHSDSKYIFIVLQYPLYDLETNIVTATEVDFFIGKNFLITVHTGELQPLLDIVKMYEIDQLAKAKLDKETISSLTYKINNNLYNYCYPLLNDIDNDISNAEKSILTQNENNVINTILTIKRNIVDFQRIMQSHSRIWQKFIVSCEQHGHAMKSDNNFNSMIDYSHDIWDYLKNYKDTINALHETQGSIISLKINEIIKTLTIFSVIVFPLTLLAAIFGMNTMNSMPFKTSRYDFWYIIAIMLTGVLTMFGFFKKKKWL